MRRKIGPVDAFRVTSNYSPRHRANVETLPLAVPTMARLNTISASPLR